jgi:hypothetical protein
MKLSHPIVTRRRGASEARPARALVAVNPLVFQATAELERFAIAEPEGVPRA